MSTDGAAGRTASDAQMADWARILTADPTDPVFSNLAAALLARNAPRRALLVLRAALPHHPRDIHGRVLLGEALLATGDANSCMREMARLLSAAPDNVDAMVLLARSLRLSGQFDEADVIVHRAAVLAPDDPRVKALASPTVINVREPDGRMTDLGDETSASVSIDSLNESTVLDEEPPSLENLGLGDDDEDATRPMETPFLSVSDEVPLFDDSDDAEPTVQVSPSLALEAAELVAAGLILGRPSFDIDVDPPDATRPLEIVKSAAAAVSDAVTPASAAAVQQELADLDARPRNMTHAEAPPSMRGVEPGDIFDDIDPTAAQPRRAQKTTTELDSRRLAGAPLAPLTPLATPPLEPTRELSQLDLSERPGLPGTPALVGPSIEVQVDSVALAPPRPDRSIDLPQFDWEMPEVSEERPSTVQLPRRRPGTSQPKARPPSAAPNTVSSRPSARSVKPAQIADPPPLDPDAATPTPIVKPRAAARDLLDVPLDPSEFKNMPRGAPRARHAVPDDLRTGPVPVASRAPKARPAPPSARPLAPKPRPAPPKRPAPPPQRPAPPPKRPAPQPKRPAPPPARPAPPPARPAPPPARPAPPPARPAPQARPAPGARRPNQPPPPARPAPARRGRRKPDGAASTTFAPRAAAPRRTLWPYIVAGLIVTLAAITVTTVVAYRNALRRADTAHAAARRDLNVETHAGRINATRTLEAITGSTNPLALLGDRVARLFGGAGLTAPAAARDALLARVLAERIFRDAELHLRERATQALAQANERAGERGDTRLAELILALDRRDHAAADAALQAMDQTTAAQAPALFYRAHLALQRGDRGQATTLTNQALTADAGYVPAELLMLEFQLERGLNERALAGYAELLVRVSDHVGVYVAARRARVRSFDKDSAAVADLKKVLSNLEKDNAEMSPAQLALLHDTIGLFYTHRDTALAKEEFDKAAAAAPERTHFLVGQARLDLLAYRLPEAEARLEKAAARFPKDPTVLVEQARARLLRGDASGAIGIVSKLDNPSLEGLLVEAEARLALSEPAAAVEALRRARRVSGGLLDVEYFRLLANVAAKNNANEALATLKSMARPTVGSRLWDQALPDRAYGIALMRANRLKTAIQVLKLVRAAYPKDHRAAAALCTAYRLQLDARPALAACRAALAINRYDLAVARMGSEIAEQYADYGAVIALLEQLKTEDPALLRRLARAYLRTDARKKLAQLLRRSGVGGTNKYIEALDLIARQNPAAALGPMAKAAERLPDDEWVQLSHAELLLRQGDSRGAQKVFATVATRSRLPHAQMGLARVALLKNDWRAASTAVKAAIRLARSSLSHPRVRAIARALEGRIALSKSGRRGWRTARRAFAAADRIAKELPEVLVGRGLLAEQQREPEAAIRSYARAVQVSPRDAEAHYLLGRLLLSATEEREQAVKILQKAVDLDPRGRYGDLARRALKGG